MADQYAVIDGDAHINEDLAVFEDLLDTEYQSRRPQMLKDTHGLTRILLEGRLYPNPRLRQAHTAGVEGTKLGGARPGARDAVARLADMDTEGIDVQVMYGSLGLAITTITDKDFGAAMARACNDHYARFCSTAPDRLKCMAALPLQDVESAVEELRRAVTELGHLGGTIPPTVDGKDLHDKSFEPLWAEAERLDVPISVHWGNGSHLPAAGTERFDTHFMVHAIGHPFEQMIAMASIITGGVFERHPALRVGFLEAGCGWAPYWLERLHEHWERRGAEVPELGRDPMEYVAKGNCFVSAEPEERGLPLAVETFGAGHVFFSSDYPHSDSAFPDAVRIVKEREDIDAETRRGLLHDAATSYYGL